jgi:hypothetical protein
MVLCVVHVEDVEITRSTQTERLSMVIYIDGFSWKSTFARPSMVKEEL